ncbi:glycosyltransferase [Neptunicoccus sediminis]|uniref:glycosyltransferase n=1 Tax=Neptunicoccus sediminis TaxID=1892596 RepID=UPI0008461A7E|nr:glycosyltransferase family 4 protein [Neptunicoccus sediminis]
MTQGRPPRIAFYAPLKPPDHDTPSGDRTIARGLMHALAQLGAVELVSRFRSREARGDTTAQAALVAEADRIAKGLIAKGAVWDSWITYHNYYKAPDLIGPRVCAALGIPYHLVEASRAPKRLHGPWADFARRADAASDAAAVIFYFTGRDLPELEKARPETQKLVHLRPFLDRDSLPEGSFRSAGKTLLAVGMLRRGDKLASYRNLAAALHFVKSDGWSLRIVGDGPAGAEVQDLFAPFGKRITFVGALDAAGVATEMSAADVFVWPGVNEAFGMVYIEAQAAGLMVVAEDRVGVRDVVGPAGILTPPDDAKAFGAAIDQAFDKGPQDSVQRRYAQQHLRGAAVETLAGAVQFKEATQ